MKIRDVEVVVLAAPGDYGLTADGVEAHGPKYTCVFSVRTDEDLTGIAQVETQPHVAAAIVGAPGEASGMFSGLRALAIRQDPLQVEPSWDRLFVGSFYFGHRGAAVEAISGIDIASPHGADQQTAGGSVSRCAPLVRGLRARRVGL